VIFLGLEGPTVEGWMASCCTASAAAVRLKKVGFGAAAGVLQNHLVLERRTLASKGSPSTSIPGRQKDVPQIHARIPIRSPIARKKAGFPVTGSRAKRAGEGREGVDQRCGGNDVAFWLSTPEKPAPSITKQHGGADSQGAAEARERRIRCRSPAVTGKPWPRLDVHDRNPVIPAPAPLIGAIERKPE